MLTLRCLTRFVWLQLVSQPQLRRINDAVGGNALKLRGPIPLAFATAVITSLLFSSSAWADSNKQVLEYVAKSIQITTVSPSQFQGLTTGNTLIPPSCDPVNPKLALHPVPCFFGDTKASKTVILYGDSIAGSWLPNLSGVMKSLRLRLAVFRYAGCPPPFIPFTRLNDTPTIISGTVKGPLWQQCSNWHNNVGAAVRKLHPKAVIIVSGLWTSPGNTWNLWVAGMAKAFDAMTKGNPDAKRILIGTGPLLPLSAPACLSVHVSNIQKCSLHYSLHPADYYGSLLSRDTSIAKDSEATLIPVTPWFCYKLKCSPVIKNFIVYVDDVHITIDFSNYLQGLMMASIKPILNKSH